MQIELTTEELSELRDALYFCHNSLRYIPGPLIHKMTIAAANSELHDMTQMDAPEMLCAQDGANDTNAEFNAAVNT